MVFAVVWAPISPRTILRSDIVSPSLLRAWRTFASLFVAVFWGISYSEEPRLWFIYLTDLTFTSLLVYFSMVAYLCWQFPVNSHSTSVEGGINPKLLIVVGYLYEHAFTFSLVVALNFWITIYKSGDSIHATVPTLHGVGSALTFVEMYLSSMPFHVSHIWVALFAAFLYGVWAVFYKLISGGDWIYGSTLNSPVTWILVFVSVVLVFMLGVGFTRFRDSRRARSRSLNLFGGSVEMDLNSPLSVGN